MFQSVFSNNMQSYSVHPSVGSASISAISDDHTHDTTNIYSHTQSDQHEHIDSNTHDNVNNRENSIVHSDIHTESVSNSISHMCLYGEGSENWQKLINLKVTKKKKTTQQ